MTMNKKYKSVILAILLIVLSICINPTFAGWGYHAHINYLKEAIRILPYYEYQMGIYYKDHLIEGLVEGEIQFKYRHQGIGPKWLPLKRQKELEYLSGLPIQENDVEKTAAFFYGHFERLRSDLVGAERRYSEVLFELGYFLHAINNVLIPLYEKGHFPEQRLASNTEEIDLTEAQIDEITDLKSWLHRMLSQKLQIRSQWSETADAGDMDAFIEQAHQANLKNITVMASILHYILHGCLGPADSEVMKEVAQIHESRLKMHRGRKPWIE